MHRSTLNLFALCCLLSTGPMMTRVSAAEPEETVLLATEKLPGDGVWKMAESRRTPAGLPIHVTVWFEDQFLGDGTSYSRRAKELASWKRRELRKSVVSTLKAISEQSYAKAKDSIDKLVEAGSLSNVERHWVVNGFSGDVSPDHIGDLEEVPGVRKIFRVSRVRRSPVPRRAAKLSPLIEREAWASDRFLHPWYTRALLADRVWEKFGVAGKGTLNVIHDFNFVLSDAYAYNLYRNPNEIPDNGKDDDGNGLVDDYHGYNFQIGSPLLAVSPAGRNTRNASLLHGSMCASIVCGAGHGELKHEFGIAPEGRWAGVIGAEKLESAVEWAIEQEADTYSMSFSMPGLGEYRSHWRKVMEHGSFCGIYFVSGAGNFAQSARIPVQMRTPEDIPDVVFAAAGVQRNLMRTSFSSKGPVLWKTEHYQDGHVQKPEVCAFNMGLPLLLPNSQVVPTGMNGNSFAGPMFCGAIALMVSADPDLLPWDLKEIITSTATDLSAEGVDDETGHGLINCYRAVKEVLRRKAVREGVDATKYEGREDNDVLDTDGQMKLKRRFTVAAVQPNSPAAKKGVQVGDIIVSCGGKPTANMQQFRAAKAAAAKSGAKTITVVYQRGAETIPLEFIPGNWGMAAGISLAGPVFR
ncbi:MAG: S8 family serine peptidase [Pirellulaceae bacterium]